MPPLSFLLLVVVCVLFFLSLANRLLYLIDLCKEPAFGFIIFSVSFLNRISLHFCFFFSFCFLWREFALLLVF